VVYTSDCDSPYGRAEVAMSTTDILEVCISECTKIQFFVIRLLHARPT
jgi:hypothetical protein